MSLFNVKLNQQEVSKGKWFEFFVDDIYIGEVKILCCKKSKDYAKSMMDLNTKYQEDIKAERNEDEISKAFHSIIAKSVLGFKNEDGEDLKPKHKDVIEMLEDEAIGGDFLAFVQDKSLKITNFLEEKKEEIVKK